MWNVELYQSYLNKIKRNLKNKIFTPYDYMLKYKQSIKDENYELAKAITEILKSLNFDTKDTHNHIKELNK